jgi:septal ring-binding cell division protein DamX
MSYGGKRGAAERVLEGRHVIGLFLAVILLSGLFFTLGYVMGLHQSEAEASADNLPAKPELRNTANPESVSKRAQKTTPAGPPTDTGKPDSSEWEFYHAGEKNKNEDLLKPAPAVTRPQPKSDPVMVKAPAPRSATPGSSQPAKGSNVPAAPANGYSLQVAAMNREADALDLAKLLQKKRFPAYVLSPHGDKYYRVQVGPYADLKATDAARKGLEAAGFKAFVKR